MDEDNPSSDNKEQPKSSLKTNDKQYSKTDPDASIIKQKNKPTQLAYKQHIAVDSGSARIITACTTTSAKVADEHKLPHLISKAHHKHGILPKKVGADTKYGTADNYRFLTESQIKPSVPHHGGKNATGLSAKNNFTYDKGKDQYTCPQGKIPKKRGFVKALRYTIYTARYKDCNGCKLKGQCTKSSTGRSVTRHVNEVFLEQAKEHLKTPLAGATIKQRGSHVEPVFACQKKDLGLKRAKFRGLASVHIQSLLTATAYNLKKLLKYSKGFKEKLKTPVTLPILPVREASAATLGQKLADFSLISAASTLKNLVFLFIKCILAPSLAYTDLPPFIVPLGTWN